MQKIANFVKKPVVEYLLLFVICLILFSVINTINFSFDNVYNTNSIIKLYNGLVMYKDFNLIVTPLFMIIGTLFVKVFGVQMLSINIYNGAIFGSIITCFYHLLKKRTLTKAIKLLIIGILTLLFLYYQVASYNWLFIVFELLLIITELSSIKNDATKKVLSGLLLGCMFLTKQSMGLVIGFAYFLYIMIKTKNIKVAINKLLIIGSSFLVMLIPFIIYLIYNNAINDFLDLAFFNISKFKNNLMLQDVNFIVIFLILNIIVIGIGIKKYDLKNKNELIVPMMGLFNLLFAYPIFDAWHCAVGYCISFFYIMILCFEFLQKCSNHIVKVLLKYLPILGVCLIVVVSSSYLVYPFTKSFDQNTPSFFKYQYTLLSFYLPTIQDVEEWTNMKESEGYDILMVTPFSTMHELVSQEFRFKYSILLDGNYGLNGAENVINEIKKLKGDKTLILHYYGGFYQESLEIHEFIVNNYEEIGTIDYYTIYK